MRQGSLGQWAVSKKDSIKEKKHMNTGAIEHKCENTPQEDFLLNITDDIASEAFFLSASTTARKEMNLTS